MQNIPDTDCMVQRERTIFLYNSHLMYLVYKDHFINNAQDGSTADCMMQSQCK